jgi:hypothetical protein
MNIHDIVAKLRQEKLRLERQTEKVNAALVALGSLGGHSGKRVVSASARRRMSLAQKARWKKRRSAKKAVAQMK